MIDAYRERIIIQKLTIKKDKNANHIKKWSDYYKCYAYVNNLSGSEYYEAKKTNTQHDVIFSIRYSSETKDIDSVNFRVIFRGKPYNITFVDNVMYKNQTIKLRATKEALDEKGKTRADEFGD